MLNNLTLDYGVFGKNVYKVRLEGCGSLGAVRGGKSGWGSGGWIGGGGLGVSDGVEKGRWMGPQAKYGGRMARKVCRGFPYFYITLTKQQKCLVIPDLFCIILW